MSAASLDRAACIVGIARHTWRTPGKAPEPLAMWEHVAREAVADAGVRADVLAELDHLGVVHCQSWTYDDPGQRLADRLGRPDVHHTTSILAGTSPQRLLDAAAEAMRRGELDVALVVGAEAGATRRCYSAVGEVPPWSHAHPSPPGLADLLDGWVLPTEALHGILPAWLTFALLEQARWAASGASSMERERLVRQMAELSRVAEGNPGAWFRRSWDPAQLRSTEHGNRLVATPYTKHMVAFPDVDMAAANLLVSHATAERWGVPPERRVYLRGWGFARDASHIAARAELGASPAMRLAQGEALTRAGVTVDEVDVFDLYSCFGSAVAFARDALGLHDGDPRAVSLTGGLPYHGGPGSNYMGHSISHMVEHLRANPKQTGMVTGVGMHMTKHVAAVYATEPGIALGAGDHGPQRAALPPGAADVPVAAHTAGAVAVLAATVVHGRNSEPERAVAICERPDGRRCYAQSSEPDVVSAVLADAWVKVPAAVVPNDDGTNDLDL